MSASDERTAGGSPALSKPDGEPVSFMDPEISECPYEAYQAARDEAPVYYDPVGGFYVLTRYEDIRAALLDVETYSCQNYFDKLRSHSQAERARQAEERFRTEGWLPGPSILQLGPERHKPLRAVFDGALRAGKVREMEPFVRETAYQLVDEFAADGKADFVAQFAMPFPLIVIITQVGAPKKDMWRIKEWTEAWINRIGLMLDDEQDARAVGLEIEFQHYMMDIVRRLRSNPDDTILSDLVNSPMPDGGMIEDGEMLTHILSDLLVGGSETTTNALSSGIMLMCRNPEVQAALREDRDAHLRTFVEEVLRLESPVQGLFRVAGRTFDLHGVTIPEGAMIHLRYGAANRDERQFGCPAELDLARRNAATHVAFGSGPHHCVGATLARRELQFGFSAMLDRTRDIRLAEGNDFAHMHSVSHRALKRLLIEFDPA